MTDKTLLFHISDIHFGLEDDRSLDWVVQEIAEKRPAAVVITGDLTMRARPREFDAACHWIRSLDVPVTVEVGNHDLPYFNLLERFVNPYKRFHRIRRVVECPIDLPGLAIVPLKTEHDDDSISRAQEWLHQNFQRSFPLESLAARVGMSLRNFVRRFKEATGDSPINYLQKLRVAAARRMLENHHRTVQEISEAVGYQDVAFFRGLFQRHTGSSPTAYQRSFGRAA